MRRRTFLRTGATALAPLFAAPQRFLVGAEPAGARPKIAAVFSELRFRSHAYNILENFFAPYLFNGALVDPGVEIVSFYVDQFPKDDLARGVSKQLQVPIFRTIDEALCVGGKELAVDGVLMIGEHGEYLINEFGVREYPRKLWFDQIMRTMRRSNRFVPVFNDKHFSYRWDWAKEMVDEARSVGMPLMGGSSVPLAERRPALELPADAPLEEALSIHGGGLESYDFHSLEILQSFVEGRLGPQGRTETGVASIEFFDGEAARSAAAAGRWSPALFAAAMEAEAETPVVRQPRPPLGERPQQIREEKEKPPQDNVAQIKHAIAITYRDGLRATVLAVGTSSNRWNFACKLRGETKPRATVMYNGPWGNRGLFKALSHAVQRFYIDRREPWPAERTLLTTGMTAAAIRAKQTPGRALETPELAIAYVPTDWRSLRETGATWKQITVDTPQPRNFEPGDARFVRK
ncbi:MAG: hypothetical protein K8U03_16245 [Planctomycetia bacterium]|nr:hypothetical protein [Planctomycetia bacterium]